VKFCSECGTKFVGSAKFCGECGKPRTDTVQIESVSASDRGLNWESFVKTYKPKKNQFAEINEAFDGFFFPHFGTSGSWCDYLDAEEVWTILAEGTFGSLLCKSGRWDGSRVVGYFYCKVAQPDAVELSFQLPAIYSAFGSDPRFLLVLDSESEKWRPPRFRLVGDNSHLLSGLGNLFAIETSQQGIFQALEENMRTRYSLRVMGDFSFDTSTVGELAQIFDSRYLFVARPPRTGWVDSYLNEYHPLSEMADGWDLEDANYILVNEPIHYDEPYEPLDLGVFYETIVECVTCQSDVDQSANDWHVCSTGELPISGLGSFQANTAYEYGVFRHEVVEGHNFDEATFRSRMMPLVMREFQSEESERVEWRARAEDQFAATTFMLALGCQKYDALKLIQPCLRCATLNPVNVGYCYRCALGLAKNKSKTLEAVFIVQGDLDTIQSMDLSEFMLAADIWYR
jgi:hypothetical protein